MERRAPFQWSFLFFLKRSYRPPLQQNLDFPFISRLPQANKSDANVRIMNIKRSSPPFPVDGYYRFTTGERDPIVLTHYLKLLNDTFTGHYHLDLSPVTNL